MRLLHVNTLELSDFAPNQVPKYAILSHRWGSEESTYQEAKRKHGDDVEKQGFKKIQGFAEYVKKHLFHVEWIWVDTCCINKENAAELSEAINSMYEWYSSAEVCIAFLADVTIKEDLEAFKRSAWFRRGWTLQELVAPRTVVFVMQTWEVVGHKGKTGRCRSGIDLDSGPALTSILVAVTGIPDLVLDDFQQSKSFSFEERLQWADGRQTTREEDESYCLLGIFGVNMPAIYGERRESARRRLLEAIHAVSESYRQQYLSTRVARKDADGYRKMVDWLSPSDPQENHVTARQKHESKTGTWLFDSDQYQRWRSSSSGHLWLSGKAGCGKTVLCSSVVEDVRAYCEGTVDTGYAMFYFSFSDTRKQSYANLLRSLVAQLAWVEPAQSKLRQAYERPNASVPGPHELEEILLLSTRSYRNAFLILDALDECPESDAGDARQQVLRFLERLSEGAPKVKIFATSRDVLDIGRCMDLVGAYSVLAAGQRVSSDIRKYVSTQISRDQRLHRLQPALKTLIADTLSQKADGMFRWAFCQLEELKKLRCTKPSRVKQILNSLPTTLDETYERMLAEIAEECRHEAIVLLQWLAYARSPPSLGELVEAMIINLDNDTVETEDRGSPGDTLDILAGLVTVIEDNRDDVGHGDENETGDDRESGDEDDDDDADKSSQHDIRLYRKRVGSSARVRLAHYSVKEYLESERVPSKAERFHLDEAAGNRFLAQSCLTYLLHYSKSEQKKASEEDLETFPMLEYAAQTWPYHSSLQQTVATNREVALLCSEEARHDWLLVHQPDRVWEEPFERGSENIGPALYYASFEGLKAVVDELLVSGHNVNAQGGYYGNALQAASLEGYETVVKMLIDGGADVNAQGGYYGNALQAASYGGHERVVKMLISAGAHTALEQVQ